MSQSPPTPVVLSLLQDPRNGGGVGTVNRWYRRWMELHRPGENREAYLDDFGPFGAFSRRVVSREKHGAAMPKLLPHAHVPQYWAGRQMLKRGTGRLEEVHVLGGVAVHAWMAPPTAPSIVWIGTTIGDERRPVLRWHDARRRLLYRATLPALERLERTSLLRAKKVLAQSPHTADVVRALGVPAGRLEVLPVPVELEAQPWPADQRSGVLYVGRVDDPRKNFGAVVRLVNTSPEVRMAGVDVVAPGSRPDGVAQGIRWLGHVPDIGAVFGRALVFVMPSRQEGLGIAAFEALASGTPVVALRCGGPDRFLAESGGGLVVDDDDELRDAVESLLRDGGARAQMGDAGRRWVAEHMSGSAFLEDDGIFRL